MRALNSIKVGRRLYRTLKRMYSAVCRSKMDYGYQLYHKASSGRQKKLNSIHKEGIRIYTGIFRMSPVESLHTEACDPILELRRNKLGLRFLYRLRSNSTYTESLKYSR